MRRYIDKWPELELARNGKRGSGIGSKLEGTGLGIVPEWWPLESELARNWVRWSQLQPYCLTIDTLDGCSKFQWI